MHAGGAGADARDQRHQHPPPNGEIMIPADFKRLTIRLSAAVATLAASVTLAAASSGSASWPQMAQNTSRNSYINDASFTASSASSMGVKWMANLYDAALGSPVIAYNSTLNKTLAYIGTERGDVLAVDISNGQTVWSANVGVNDSIRSSPAVGPDGGVFVGTVFNPTFYKLNGATGAVQCSVKAPYAIDGSPLMAAPNGVPTVYFGTVDGPQSGPTYSINESNCAQNWAFTNYSSTAGPWASPSYAVTKE